MPVKSRDIGARWVLLSAAFCCFFVLGCQRMNMNIAMLCMVNWTEVKTGNYCLYPDEKEEISVVGEFPWSLTMQSQIHMCYFYGVTFMQLPSELLLERLNAKHMAFLGMLLSSICTVVTPTITRLHFTGIALAQILKAMGHTIILTAFGVMFGDWIPTKQLIHFISHATCGLPLGAFITVILTGNTCNDAGSSWPFIFHLTGSLGIVWCLPWFFLCRDIHFEPVLRSSSGNPYAYFPKPKLQVPFGKIFSSKPFWGYVASGIASYWILATNMFVMPIYFRNVFNISIEWIALLSSFPNILGGFLYIFSFNFLTRKVGSRTSRRKTFVCLGIFTFATCMVLLSFISCQIELGVSLMVIAVGASGFSSAGISLIPVDMSPNFSGILCSIMNTIGAIAGALLPYLVVLFTEGKADIRNWEKTFYACFFITFISMILFMAYSSSKIQPWDSPSDESLETLSYYGNDNVLFEILPGISKVIEK